MTAHPGESYFKKDRPARLINQPGMLRGRAACKAGGRVTGGALARVADVQGVGVLSVVGAGGGITLTPCLAHLFLGIFEIQVCRDVIIHSTL